MSGVAIVHDNLVQMGGAERVLQALMTALPGARVHTTLAAPWKLSRELREADIVTTWMQRLPKPDRLYRHYFLLYPSAIARVDVRQYDLVVSSCWGYSKGVRKRPDAVHVCYCHTPMRLVWRYDDYMAHEPVGAFGRRLLHSLVQPLRWWDLRAAERPDFFIANSKVVAARIRDIYRRDSVVIPPPIDLARFRTSQKTGDYFLVVSRLIAYKRIELAIEACNLLGRRLVIVGDGPDRARLEALKGPTIEFLGRQPDEVVQTLAAECVALLFPGEEDFGIVPLEANASGRPVVAWHDGGALETVLDGETGVFFEERTARSLADAIKACEVRSWNADALRAHAAEFDRGVFVSRLKAFLRDVSPAGQSADRWTEAYA